MAKIPIPKKLTVDKYFADAKEVVCLQRNIKINIASGGITKFDNGQWLLGAVVIWSEGKFAEITKTKSGKCVCKNCNCSEKKA